MSVLAIAREDPDATIKCECGKDIFVYKYEKHKLTKSHIKLMTPKKDHYKLKLEKYEQNKDINNCCGVCLKTDIPIEYFIPSLNLCLCCDEVLKGGQKRCKICKEMKDIDSFERPYLCRCKNCASKKAREKVICPTCKIQIDYGNFSRHNKNKHS